MDYHLSIKDLPEADRPRERLFRFGPEALSNAELLALLLRTGNKGESALDLAHRLLSLAAKQGGGFRYLITASLEELSHIRGIGAAKASLIKAALEIGRRLAISTETKPVVKSPRDVGNLVMEKMRYLDREHFEVLLLDTKNQVLAMELISVGTLNSSVVHPREVFKVAIKRSAAGIVLVHNHPSGDPTPSRDDLEVSRRLVEAGRLLGIDVLDHVIIGDNRFLSFKEAGLS
ncbi:MAG: DNA repair protein RadC [Firmicutes bacterium]|nr:DNA repair protein RadC [Bacillota bacterium]MCL5039424.1 DNA repair protein RadC [Bacillota bacterium]